MKKVIFFCVLIFFSNTVQAQNIIKGKIVNDRAEPLTGVTIRVKNSNIGVFSDQNGNFILDVSSPTASVRISFLGYKTIDTVLQAGKYYLIELKPQNYQIQQVETYGYYSKDPGTTYLKSRVLQLVPSVSGNLVETLIMTSMGVQSTNELSSQYSVRGGSYDENLVYIDGLKIFRPMLIRSGQQEGLSIINPDLVQNIKFSAGGFSAEYGDKMSSVLDITYRTPDTTEFSASFGLTGASVHAGITNKKHRLSLLTGLRIKQNAYLLNALPVKGNYKPVFTDFQAIVNYKLSPKLSLRLFSYFSYNQYNFYPDSLTVAIGTFTQNFRLPVYYTGQEKDRYLASLNAFTLKFKPLYNFQITVGSSFYRAYEQERYTLSAIYRLDMVDNQFTGSTRDSVVNIGLGAYLNYGRDFLNLGVWRNILRINYELGSHSLIFGLEHQSQRIIDNLTRWKYIDSAGFSFNYNKQDTALNLFSYTRAFNDFSDSRLDVYFVDYFRFYAGRTNVKLNYGLRGIYWALGEKFYLDPRFSVYLTPQWQNKWTFRLSAGMYTQVPFYNDLRNINGQLTQNPHSQRALHLLAGAYRNFTIWNRPFRFTTEWYYKRLFDLIPFEYDNLRIQYYADQIAQGYAYGADFRLFGQFVSGTDSWISISLLHTAEDIQGDSYWQYIDKDGNITDYKPLAVDSTLIEPGYIPRPTDQLLTIGMFFQDYMPQNKNMKVSLGLFYGSGHPFGPPAQGRYKAIYRMPAYLRADLGFMYIWHPKFAKSIIFEVDLLNAFDAMNVASYSWLTILTNPALVGSPLGNAYMVQIAVPNYLTGRLINFKIKLKF